MNSWCIQLQFINDRDISLKVLFSHFLRKNTALTEIYNMICILYLQTYILGIVY